MQLPSDSSEASIFLLRKLWRFAEENRKKIVLFVLMFMMANGIMLLGPLLFGSFIGEIQRNGLSSNNIGYLFLILLAMYLKEFFFWLLHGPARVMERMVAFSAMLNYRRYLLAGLFEIRLSWHNEHDSGDTIDKVDKAGEALFEFGQNVYQIIEIVAKLLGTTIVLLWFSPLISLLVFSSMVVLLMIMHGFDKRLISQYRGLNEFANKAHAAVFDALSNITTVKILHIEASVLKGVLSRYGASKKLYHENSVLNEAKWFTGLMLFQAIALAPVGLYIYYQIQQGRAVDVGRLSTLFMYLSELMLIFFRFGSIYEQITVFKNRVVNVENLERAFLIKNSLARSEVKIDWQKLSLEDLTFKYDDEGQIKSLDQVSLSFRRGERIAVIGESGSGKTTFLKVLHGMYPKASGLLILDEQKPLSTSLSDIDLKTMLVPQEPEIFSSSIRENITLGIDYSDEKVLQAAQRAAFFDVIAELPQGLDSVINEKGVNLSGGQKQRLALSRALLFSENKEILLLDESTSSVDPENEYAIYENIWQAFLGKTIIASIHKMNLLKFFDRIVIFDQGRIVDAGTFNELLKKNEHFKKMWEEFIAQS